jgi:thiamine-phosphate pyrophosphorylase
MELIVVTLPDYFDGEAELINQLFTQGLRLLHIRKPVDHAVQFRALMKGIHPEYYPRISIHQHHELAAEFAIHRLHFKEQQRRELSFSAMEGLLSAGFTLSSSVHDLAEISHLEGFDYVFFGPVFNSISKNGYHGVLADNFVLPAHKAQVFAIGGVQEDKMEQIQKMNFDGAAVLGSLWQNELPPVAALQNLLLRTDQLNKSIKTSATWVDPA